MFMAAKTRLSESKYMCNRSLQYLDPAGPLTALASSPGSGNTWTRYLIQQVSGYHTGAIYKDPALRNSGFPAEGITDGTVIAIKTHQSS